MSARDNVIRLWKERRPDIKSVAELERKINLSNGIIAKWDTIEPFNNADAMQVKTTNVSQMLAKIKKPLQRFLSRVA